MQQTNDNTERNLIQRLQPKVSGFSQTFHLNGVDGEKVICGGKIKSITDMSAWSSLDGSDIVYVLLDDSVGELLVVVPGTLWRELSAELNDIIIAEGMLHYLKKDCTFQSKAGVDIVISRKDEPVRVLVRKIRKLGAE